MSYLCMLSFAMVFQSIPPLLTLILQEFGVSHAEVGLLMSLFALPGILVALPGGIISDRFGMRKTGTASSFLMIIGALIVGTSSNLFQAYLGRIVSGAGGLTLAIVLPQLVSKWFSEKELSVGMGIFNTAMPLGTILSFNIFSIMGESFGWQTPIFITSIIGIVALSAFLWFFKEPIESSDKARNGILENIANLGLSIWLVGISWMWFNAAFISFLTFSSVFLTTRGFGSASFLSSIVMMGSLLLSPVVGYFIHKIGREELFVGISGAILAALIYLVLTSPLIILLLVLIGIFVAFVPAPIFSLPSKLVKSKDLGLAFGIMTACLNIGVLLGPYLTGLVKDLTGDYSVSFYLMSLFALLQTITILIFRLRKRS